jgi:hypothetical protein
MLVMFILGLVLIAMIAVAAQSLSGMYSVLNDLEVARQERQVDMLWESGVSSLLVQAGPQGEFIAPAGTPLTDSSGSVVAQGLPDALAGPRVNSRGYSPLYCALGRSELADGEPKSTVVLEAGISYSVQNVKIGSITYVRRSSAIPGLQRGSSSIAAFIISPLEPAENLSCADIRYDQVTGLHSIPGIKARIVPIFAANGGTLSSAEAVNRSSSQFIDASAYTSINEALAPYLSNPPSRLTLNMPARMGGYTLTGDLIFGSSSGPQRSHLIIAGPSDGVQITGQYTLTVKNAGIELQNIGSQANLNLDHAQASFSGTSLANLSAVASDLDFNDHNTITGSVSIDSTDVYQQGALTLTYGTGTEGPLTLISSRWKTRSADLNLTSQSSLYGIWVDQASQFVASGSTLTFGSGYAQAIRVASDSVFRSIDSSLVLQGQAATFIDIKGRADIESGVATSSGSLGSGAVLRDGGLLMMDNGQQWFYSGMAPAVGISDAGGLAVSGSSAHVGGQVCWDGYLFSDSSVSQVANNNNKNLNGRATASWSCHQ